MWINVFWAMSPMFRWPYSSETTINSIIFFFCVLFFPSPCGFLSLSLYVLIRCRFWCCCYLFCRASGTTIYKWCDCSWNGASKQLSLGSKTSFASINYDLDNWKPHANQKRDTHGGTKPNEKKEEGEGASGPARPGELSHSLNVLNVI